MPSISIHWLHLTDQDLSKAGKVIDAFKEDDTVDVLGFQPISEVFDNWFYPAVTTPMTRARYYLLIPAIYIHLQRRGLGTVAFRDQAASLQHRLQRLLVKKEGSGRGVIGQQKEEKIKRLPSAIYWSSFGDLEILLPRSDHKRWSEAEYQRAATASRTRETVETDEGVDAEESSPRFWDSEIPLGRILNGRQGPRRSLGLSLSVAESDYLQRKFEEMPTALQSLIVYRLRRRLAGPYDHAWDLLKHGALPRVLRSRLKHARSFSSAARALSLVYYAMVVQEQRKRHAGPGGYVESLAGLSAEFEFWWRNGRSFVTRGWDVGAFQVLVGTGVFDARDRADFELLVQLVRSTPGPQALFNNRSFRRMIREREHQKRPGKCRLCGTLAHRKYLKQWGKPPRRQQDRFQLRFRHHVGDTIARDILRKPYLSSADVQD